MGRLTIDLDGDTSRRVADAAAAAHMAVGEWIAAMVRARVTTEWPSDVRALAGAWPDFPELDDLRANAAQDIKREDW